ncbi:hypothetical protein RHGRI_011986 [Rhododendron griersonianum]|uniref:RING-type domain-containing protein n=1 Tax=Rhododendron griersonianum TaxID=479676 RepID=A0AAV6KQ59_9ERIC|nr:hypothetical protein RHGRI_011986 [Rhododendron griersonianum]
MNYLLASAFPINTREPVAQARVVPATTPSSAEDLELAMAINASTQFAMQSRSPYVDVNPVSGASTSSGSQSGWVPSPLPSDPPVENAVLDGGASSSCVICLDAPVEGACIPCGHMVGCMSCLNEIKGKRSGVALCVVPRLTRLYVSMLVSRRS